MAGAAAALGQQSRLLRFDSRERESEMGMGGGREKWRRRFALRLVCDLQDLPPPSDLAPSPRVALGSQSAPGCVGVGPAAYDRARWAASVVHPWARRWTKYLDFSSRAYNSVVFNATSLKKEISEWRRHDGGEEETLF
jgi:hypothetical protein